MGVRRSFEVGDRVRVAGGYDMDPAWLDGGTGYVGRIAAIEGSWAAVQLDSTIALRAPSGGWDDFASGNSRSVGKALAASGSWLALALAYTDALWQEPITRVHVSLCTDQPAIGHIPTVGGIGIWVESHATMLHI